MAGLSEQGLKEKPVEDVLTSINLPPYMEPLTNLLKEINDMQKIAEKEDLSTTLGKGVPGDEDELPTNVTDIKHQMSWYKKELNHTKQDILRIRKALAMLADVRNMFQTHVDPTEKDEDAYEERLAESLMESAETLPLYVGQEDGQPPPLCGAIQVQADYVSKVGDMVAAFVSVKGKDEEDWILSKVNGYNAEKDEYEICDIDKDSSLYRVARNNVIPLPSMRAHPTENPEAIFEKGSIVLALYPKTTCFYKGVVYESPSEPHKPYLVCFEDSAYSGGFSRPDPVPQRYVLVYKSTEFGAEYESTATCLVESEANSGNEIEEANANSCSDCELGNKSATESEDNDETDESKTEDESMDKPDENLVNKNKLKGARKSKARIVHKIKVESASINETDAAEKIEVNSTGENRAKIAGHIKIES